MSNDLSEIVVQAMLPHLDNAQMGQLINVLNQVLPRFVVSPRDELEPAPLGPSGTVKILSQSDLAVSGPVLF